MFDFKGINFESIKLRIGSVFSYRKEEHNEKTLNVDARKTEVIGTQIGQQQIAQQVVFNLPEGFAQNEKNSLVEAVLGKASDSAEGELVSPDATGGTTLPAGTTSPSTEKFLKDRLKEYTQDPKLLLERGALFYIYKERNNIAFTEQELVFLVQSSLMYDFPFWFWAFYYREKFGHILPLFQAAYVHTSIKIRIEVLDALDSFTETAEGIVTLEETENNLWVLGSATALFLEKELPELAQRIVANALSRRKIPVFSEKFLKKLKRVKIDLGAAEKRFLYGVVNNGWPEEKIQALQILKISAEEADLPTLEGVLAKSPYGTITELIISCIERIGKTNVPKEVQKEMTETRRYATFLTALSALAAIGYEPVVPQLLEWLRSGSRVSSRLWGEADASSIEGKVGDALSKMLNGTSYELLVQDILSKFTPNEYGNIMSWRHFWVLKEQAKKPEIVALIKTETRLEKYERWQDVLDSIQEEEITETDSPETLLDILTPDNLRQGLHVLRRLCSVLTPIEALEKVASAIQTIRDDLKKRLTDVEAGDHTDEIKEIARNDLEKFLGDNRSFYGLYRKTKRLDSSEEEEKKDTVFTKLSDDIDKFSTIEKEYLTQVFKAETTESNKLLSDSIGRPYEIIYESLKKETADSKILEEALVKVIRDDPNPILKLKAIEAARRIGVIDTDLLRVKALTLLEEAKESVKSRGGLMRDDGSFASEIAYLWGINTIVEFGNANDFPLVEESVNREKILSRSYHKYSNFLDNITFETLLQLVENLEDEKERDSAMLALRNLDYKWTKQVLGIEA